MKVPAIANSMSRSNLRWTLRTFLLCVFLLGPYASSGQDASFSITSWGTRSGLPEMSVQALSVDAEGGLYVGTAGGLCFFDGSYCKPLENREMGKFPPSYLTVLLRGKDRSLWAGTEGGGLLHITADHVELFDQRNGLSDPHIRALLEDSIGRLWVATDRGLFLRTGEVFKRIPLPNREGRPQADAVYALAEDSRHRLVVGGNHLVYMAEPDDPLSRSVEISVPYPIRSLLFTKDGQLLLGTLGGVYKDSDGKFIKLPTPPGDVEKLSQSADGTVWAGTVSNGLWRLTGNTATQIPIGGNGPTPSILSMTTDASGRLWIGTETGLTRIEPTDIQLIQSPAAGVDSETLAVSPKGDVLLVNNQVYRLDDRKLTPLFFQVPGRSKKFLNMLYASDHSVWLGTAGNGVFRLDRDGHTTQNYSTYSPSKIAGDFPRGIVEGVNGEIWVANRFGLNKIKRSAIEQYDSSNGLPNGDVRTLLKDREGCMWIGTEGGVADYCNGRFVDNGATRALQGEEISAMTEDENGTMWLGTRNHGLYAYREPNLRHFSASDGLMSNFICGLITDRAGTLWISSPELLSSISLAQLHPQSGDANLVFARLHQLPKGAENVRFGGVRFPNASVDNRGAVWFATTRGAVYVDQKPLALHAASDGPVPLISAVRADDTYVQKAAKVRLPSGTKLITFALGSIYLGSERDILLAYRLKGVDEKWMVSDESQEVQYREIPAGSYTFELRAYDRADSDAWKSTYVSFVIPVVWYRSPWFYVTLLPSLAALCLLLYKMHLRRIQSRFRLILEERARLAREMHDTLIQGCNGVAMLLEAEASSRGGPDSGYLNVAREQLQATVADAREAVWNLRQTAMDSDVIIASLKNISTQASESFGIPVVVSHPSKLPQIPADTVHEVLMIVREAVANAAHHGRPHSIDISVEHVDHHLLLRVSDDGIGFDVQGASGPSHDHYGILGMQERAEMIGADFEITSVRGSGTCIQIRVKVTS